VEPKFIWLQNYHDGTHPDVIMKDFRALLDNMLDETQHAAIFSVTREFIKYSSHNKLYISAEQLHAMELCIYHVINVQVEGLDGEAIFQMCRCTGSQSRHRGDRWIDRVYVMQCPG
jgi:hypothetical protein